MRAGAILALVAMLGLFHPELIAVAMARAEQPSVCALGSHGCKHHQQMVEHEKTRPTPICHTQRRPVTDDESRLSSTTICSCSSDSPGAVTVTGHPPFTLSLVVAIAPPVSPSLAVHRRRGAVEGRTTSLDPPPPRRHL
jgi:hypothetical protein